MATSVADGVERLNNVVDSVAHPLCLGSHSCLNVGIVVGQRYTPNSKTVGRGLRGDSALPRKHGRDCPDVVLRGSARVVAVWAVHLGLSPVCNQSRFPVDPRVKFLYRWPQVLRRCVRDATSMPLRADPMCGRKAASRTSRAG